ncbi:MAG: chemotaxis protein CheW [Spirochaetota bacterium]|nr:chemotaxis protein CheW [Spirochaetota bacterium]
MKGLEAEVLDKVDDNEPEEEAQHVTFLIGNETYGVEVLKVQEIIGMTEITHVPNTSYFMEGIINLRGSVVAVIDLRKKFKMEEREYDNFTVIIIVEVNEKLIGMIVDSVSDVANIPVSTMQSTPQFTSNIETEFIKGIGQVDDSLVIILNVDKILTDEEFNTIDIEEH